MNTALAIGDETAIQPATLRGQVPLQLAPAADRATVSILKFTVTAVERAADSTQHLRVVCGDFHLQACLPPGSPAVYPGESYCIEREKGTCPFAAPFTAIYPDTRPSTNTTYH